MAEEGAPALAQHGERVAPFFGERTLEQAVEIPQRRAAVSPPHAEAEVVIEGRVEKAAAVAPGLGGPAQEAPLETFRSPRHPAPPLRGAQG